MRYELRECCRRGHPLKGDNLKLLHRGKYTIRRCMACHALRYRQGIIRRLRGSA